jgi:hypothetical protein
MNIGGEGGGLSGLGNNQQNSKDEKHRKQLEYANALQHDQMNANYPSSTTTAATAQSYKNVSNEPGGGGGLSFGGHQLSKEEKHRKQMEYAHSLQNDQYQQPPSQQQQQPSYNQRNPQQQPPPMTGGLQLGEKQLTKEEKHRKQVEFAQALQQDQFSGQNQNQKVKINSTVLFFLSLSFPLHLFFRDSMQLLEEFLSVVINSSPKTRNIVNKWNMHMLSNTIK